MPRVDDALQFLVARLRRPASPQSAVEYGYDVYIPNVCREYAREVEHVSNQNPHDIEARIAPLSPVFYDAAWELCKRGIIRPSVKSHGAQITDDGSGGNGYSLTSVGRAWLVSTENILIPVEPTRAAEMLAGFRSSFGDGYFQRAQEAIKCYSATAYLSCCAMCGAATESILLRLAIEKNGDEATVLKMYRSASGRQRVENLVLTGANAMLATTFRNLTDLLKYWRDDASHGTASEISEFEAYEAIARLLRFAHFAEDHRAELTA